VSAGFLWRRDYPYIEAEHVFSMPEHELLVLAYGEDDIDIVSLADGKQLKRTCACEPGICYERLTDSLIIVLYVKDGEYYYVFDAIAGDISYDKLEIPVGDDHLFLPDRINLWNKEEMQAVGFGPDLPCH